MKRLGTYLALFLVLFTFVVLALPGIKNRSLWLDEGITLYNSSGDFSEVINKVSNLDLSPPFYYIFIDSWRYITGLDGTQNQILLRLPSLLFGLLSIYLVFLLGKKNFNASVGIKAAAILAINPFFIGFSQEARMYMLLTSLILAACYLMQNILQGESLKRSWLLLTLVNIIGIYTHNFYWFALLSLALTTLLFIPTIKNKKSFFKKSIVSGIVTILAFAPWISSFLKQLAVDRYWIAPLNFVELKVFLIDLAGGSKLSFYILGALILIGFSYLIFLVKNKKRGKEFQLNFYFLLVFSAFSFVLPVMYSVLVSPLVKVRYLLDLVALMSLFAAIGMHSLKTVNKLLSVIPLVVLALVWHPWDNQQYPVEMHENFAYAQDFVAANSNTDTPIIVHSPSAAHVYSFYNNGYNNIHNFPPSYDLRHYNIDTNDKQKFLDLFANYKDFWLLITHTHEEPQGILREWSQSICPQVDQKPLGSIFLVHYRCS